MSERLRSLRVRRQVTRREFGPAASEAELLRQIADAIDDGAIAVQSLVVDWRDDGCYVEVFAENYSIVRAIVRLAQ